MQLLRPRSFSSWHQDLNFQRKVSVWNCHRFDPDPHATQSHSSHHSIHRNSSHHHTKNCPCRNCQWDTSVQIPRFLKLSLVSDFQDRIGLFSTFYSCTNLCNLGMFLWIFTYSPFCLLCPHSWTMTCPVCLCQMISCRCVCVHCNLVEHMLHRT